MLSVYHAVKTSLEEVIPETSNIKTFVLRPDGLGHESALAAAHIDQAFAFEFAPGLLNGVGIDPQVGRELTYRGEWLIGRKRPDRQPAANFIHDLNIDRPGVGGIYGEDDRHGRCLVSPAGTGPGD